MVALEGVLSGWFFEVKSGLKKRDDVDFEESLEVDGEFDDIFEDLRDVEEKVYGGSDEGKTVVAALDFDFEAIEEGHD
jgi:hypothetical protein